MSFPKGFLDELKGRIRVSEVVGRKVKLTRRGREFVGLSPFSNEKSPSFTVNDDKQFYHCFSSGEHGDVIKFLEKTEITTYSGKFSKDLPIQVKNGERRSRSTPIQWRLNPILTFQHSRSGMQGVQEQVCFPNPWELTRMN